MSYKNTIFTRKNIEYKATFSSEEISSDTSLVLLEKIERKHQLIKSISSLIPDYRNQAFVRHSYASKLKASTLMIHSDGCVLPQYTKNFFEQTASEDKQLEWLETELDSPMQQFNFYDHDEEVGLAVEKGTEWFMNKM